MSLWQLICLNKNKRNLASAFTLVELLIAMAIFSVVSIAIYSTFSSGTKVLRRLNNTDLTQQKILLKIERLSRELRQQPACRKPIFAGAKTKISFAANIDNFPSRLTYYFNSANYTILRVVDKLDEIIDLDGTLDPNPHSAPSIFLTKVSDLKFSYLYLDLSKNAYLWTEIWEQEILPLAVKFIIKTEKQNYESTVYFAKN